MTEKQYFLENATFLYDTREKDNFDILKAFAHEGLQTRRETFHTGDYGFEIDGKDYRNEWIAERKGSLNEIYGNIMAKNLDADSDKRNNLEEELERMQGVKERLLFIQGAANMTEVRGWKNPRADKQGKRAGEHIYATLLSWGCANRYGFKTIFRKTQYELGQEMIAHAYYYWRNDMREKHGKNFLKAIKALGDK